jgi:DNA-binding GntR family transcriptional regulator
MTERDEGPRYNPAGIRLVYVAIADDLAAKISDGTFPPEGRLPSINDLVHEYGAARETVRKAIAQLRERGLVVVVPGKGVYAAPRAPE